MQQLIVQLNETFISERNFKLLESGEN